MYRIYLFFIFNLFCFSLVHADNQAEIDKILKLELPPFGVVFEIVESDKTDLSWAVPRIKKYSEMLRKSFPDIYPINLKTLVFLM